MKRASVAAEAKPRRGRAPKEDRGDIVLPNGLYAWQWEWFQREAKNKVPSVDAAWYMRFACQAFIDSVEASRADIREVVVPQDDQKFEELVKTTNKSKQKS